MIENRMDDIWSAATKQAGIGMMHGKHLAIYRNGDGGNQCEDQLE